MGNSCIAGRYRPGDTALSLDNEQNVEIGCVLDTIWVLVVEVSAWMEYTDILHNFLF